MDLKRNEVEFVAHSCPEGIPPVLTVSTADAQEILAEIVYAQLTYLSLIEGLPDDELNQNILKNTIPRICLENLGHEHHVVIDPILARKKMRSREWNELPRVLVAALFRCSEPVVNMEESYSALVIVWFQDRLEPLISGPVEKAIKGLIWRDLARDYSD
jgi:hypothetical protein